MSPTASTAIDTLVVGAGQAGLATGYHLARRGRSYLIVDANRRVGDNWRQQWDTLRLYSPARHDRLPALRFPAKGSTYPGKDDVADYLEQYVARFDLAVRTGTRVQELRREGAEFVVDTDKGSYRCRNVVVATGTFGRTPRIPKLAAELDPRILQLHSSEYRRPGQLRNGPVLVVGASHSGTDIAYELAQSHPTVLLGRDCGQIPVHIDSVAGRALLPVLLFAWRHVATRRTPMGRRMVSHVRDHGGPMLRVHRADLDRRGVERSTDRLDQVVDGMPVIDGAPRDVANVIWATGFRQDFDWIRLPILGADGWPNEKRGVVADEPGLYFCGLAFQYSFSSMLLTGVGRDAAYVACQICERSPAPMASRS